MEVQESITGLAPITHRQGQAAGAADWYYVSRD